MDPKSIQAKLNRILPTVQKPGRYTGGELNQVLKDWNTTQTRVALAFPDLYDLGMSNLGLAVLYDIINQQSDLLAERVFSPWPDMEAAMRAEGLPLYSLESKHAISDFDILGISLPYETLYTNTLNMLDLAGIPLKAADRDLRHPLVIAGGHATFNPEPMAVYIDAFVIGEGEEVILEVIRCHQEWKQRAGTKQQLLEALAQIWGVYVPSFYQPHYREDGTLDHMQILSDKTPQRVLKRIVAKLPPPHTRFIVPYIDVIHNRAPIEIMRGCTRGCRFCQAGMINRPVRERPVAEIVEAIEQALANTGYEEVGLLSLSSSDYSHVLELVETVTKRFAGQHLNISLPSLRIESFSAKLMDLLKGESHRGGFTLAPEAATEHMRRTINKYVTDEQLLSTARDIYSRGWHTIKLYFMIGHPLETLEDVQAIADLCKAVLAEGHKIIGNRAKLRAGVSTFIPKPHTPFQWVSCDTPEQIEAKQTLLRRELRGRGLKLNWTDPRETMLEAWLSRGDRKMNEVILAAWKHGARYDAWKEHFNYDAWMQAFDETGVDPAHYTHRERPIDETLPWDHIDAGMRKEYLTEEFLMSNLGEVRADCRQRCYACGILPKFADLRRQHPGDAWKCPEVRSPKRLSRQAVETENPT